MYTKETDAYSVAGSCGHWNTVSEAIGCLYQYCPYQASGPALTEEEIQRGIEKRELAELRKQNKQGKGCKVIAMYESGMRLSENVHDR